ncbi:hypothetical protein O6H91_Y375600 [Diphasiastrum complanatum]|nr:hypothetical protein O6H91_Y375600 [Diphasiastrum complanatum]
MRLYSRLSLAQICSIASGVGETKYECRVCLCRHDKRESERVKRGERREAGHSSAGTTYLENKQRAILWCHFSSLEGCYCIWRRNFHVSWKSKTRGSCNWTLSRIWLCHLYISRICRG